MREKLEGELAQKGLTSLMPKDAYTEPSFDFYKAREEQVNP